MQVFDLSAMASHPYTERMKNVFYEGALFKARIVELLAGGEMPDCEMASHILFYVIQGEAQVRVNEQVARIEEGQCLISEPATISMKTVAGVKLLGVQIGAV